MAEMRKVGIERLDQVKWGILEADGKLSFITVSSDAAHRSSDNTHDQQV